MTALVKMLFTSFLKYVGTKTTNSKAYRDLKDLLVRDNYHQMVCKMFEASIADAKASVDLDETIVNEILDDQINRDEVFRWILEGVTFDKFNANKLVLEVYYERFPRYQDKLIPFFQVVLLKIQEYKKVHWSPEFLEALSHLEIIQNDIQSISGTMVLLQQDTKQTLQIVSALHSLLENRNPGYEDLKKLLKEGNLDSARERALERLRQTNLPHEVSLELNAIVAETFLQTMSQEKAIPYLLQSIHYCDNPARLKRLQSLVELLSDNDNDAYKFAIEARDIEGETKENIEVLLNVLIKQKEFGQAISLIDSHSEIDLKFLRAYTLFTSSQFDSVIEMADREMTDNPDVTEWLLVKLDALVLDLETRVQKKELVNPENIYELAQPLIEKLQQKANLIPRYEQRLKELKAALYFRVQEFSKAQILFFELLNDDYDKHINSYIACCVCAKDWKTLITYFTITKLSELSKEDLLLLGKSYIEIGSPEKTVELLNTFKEHFDKQNDLLQYHILYIDALNHNVQHSEVVEYIKKIEQDLENWIGLKALHGYYSCLIQDWDAAVTNLEQYFENPISQSTLNEELKIELSTAYVNKRTLEDFKKLKTLVPTIPYWYVHDFLINRYIKSLYELGDYGEILKIYKDGELTKTEVLYEAVSSIYFNFQWYDLALKNYISLYSSNKKLDYILQSARCYYRLGRTNDCMNCLINAEKQIENKGSLEDYYLLSVAYKDTFHFEKAIHFAYQAFIQGNNSSEVWGFYFFIFTELSRFIAEPNQEWVKAYHKIFNTFKEKFPSAKPLFREVQALDEYNNPSQELIDELKNLRNGHDDVRKFYQEHRLPINFMTSLLKRGIFETWVYCVNEFDLCIWSTSGEWEELKLSYRTAKLSKKVLADISSLFTLRHLKMLRAFNDKYDTIYVHQEQFNKLLEEWRKIKIITDIGASSLSFNNGRLMMIEATPEDVKQTLEVIEEVVEWIKNNCTIVGNPLSTEIDDEEIYDFMTKTIEIAHELNCSLFIDSFLIFKFARETHGVFCFGSFEFIRAMKEERRIEQNVYYEHYASLILMGYSSLPLDIEVITNHLMKHNFIIDDRNKLLLSYFAKADLNYEYKIEKAAYLLKWLWIESSAISSRQNITDLLCYLLSNQQSKNKVAEDLIQCTKTLFGILIQHQWEEMVRNIQQWIRAQSII